MSAGLHGLPRPSASTIACNVPPIQRASWGVYCLCALLPAFRVEGASQEDGWSGALVKEGHGCIHVAVGDQVAAQEAQQQPCGTALRVLLVVEVVEMVAKSIHSEGQQQQHTVSRRKAERDKVRESQVCTSSAS